MDYTRPTSEPINEENEDLRKRHEELDEHRRLRGELEALLEAAADGIIVVAADGSIEYVNDRALEMFGFTQKEVLGQELEMLVPERSRHIHYGHRTGYFAAPMTRRMGQGLVIHGMRKDGTIFPLEIRLSPVEGNEGIQAICVIRDVNKRAELVAHYLQA